MPVALTVRYTNGAAQTLALLRANVTDLTPPLTAAKDLVLASVQRNFDTGGRPTPWAPLKRPRRRGRNPSPIPLTDTGQLRRSITGMVQGNSAIISTELAYAAIHQFGAGRVPARPFLVLQPEDTAMILGLFESHVTRGVV